MAKTTRKRSRKSTPSTGWLTSDDDEIERRRVRGATEAFQIDPLLRTGRFFGVFWVESENGNPSVLQVANCYLRGTGCERVPSNVTAKHGVEYLRSLGLHSSLTDCQAEQGVFFQLWCRIALTVN